MRRQGGEVKQSLTPHSRTHLGNVHSSPIMPVHTRLGAFPSSAKNRLTRVACLNSWACEMWAAAARAEQLGITLRTVPAQVQGLLGDERCTGAPKWPVV